MKVDGAEQKKTNIPTNKQKVRQCHVIYHALTQLWVCSCSLEVFDTGGQTLFRWSYSETGHHGYTTPVIKLFTPPPLCFSAAQPLADYLQSNEKTHSRCPYLTRVITLGLHACFLPTKAQAGLQLQRQKIDLKCNILQLAFLYEKRLRQMITDHCFMRCRASGGRTLLRIYHKCMTLPLENN